MPGDTALVTGAAQRIGASIARELHSAGLNVALHYRHSASAASALAADLNAIRPDSCRLHRADLADKKAIDALAAEVVDAYGELKLLVNNASGFQPTPLQQTSEAQFDEMLGANLKAPYFLCQQLVPALRAGDGSIINIIDVHAEHPLPGFNAYCAAKAGLASLTRSLAIELAPEIRVNGVAPGAILWPGDDAEFDAQAMADTLQRTPLGRLGDPADIASAVRFLALDAPFVTGQVLAVDGGRTLAG